MHYSKTFICILVFVSATVMSYAQYGWIQTSINAGRGYSLYVTDTEIYAATGYGVYSTIDNGMTWVSKGPGSTYDVIKSHQYLLAACYNGVYRSSNNGLTWLPTNGLIYPSILLSNIQSRLFAKNSAYVFVLAGRDQGIFRSSDDGENWQQLHLGQVAPGSIADIGEQASGIYSVGEEIFTNAGNADSAMGFSSDNGNTWHFSRSSMPLNMEGSSFWYDNGKLFSAGPMGVILSTDLGYSWTSQYSDTIDARGHVIGLGSFSDIVSYHGILIAAVGPKSIQISRDNGISWTSFNDGLMPDWIFSALAIKPPYIWAITGAFGNIYRRLLTEIVTASEWTVQISGITTPFNCVKAVNQSVAWAAGDNGKVLITSNGGQNWYQVDGGGIGVNGQDQIFAIEALDANTACTGTYSSSGSTSIHLTTNGGTTWQQVFSQQGGFIDGIKMYDAKNGIALGDPVGGKWTLLKTTNAGLTWGRIATEPAQADSEYGYVNSLATLGQSDIWFGTNSHRIYHSTDAGITWSSGAFPYANIYAIAFTDAQHGLAGSDSGYIAQTTNGGATWSYITKLDTNGISGLCVFQNNFFCSVGNTVYRSTDKGTTWAISFISKSSIKHLSFVANGSILSGWAVDDNGNIAAFSGTLTDVKYSPPNISLGFDLQQNYPNPFNPSTSISFVLPTRSFVSMKIFDLLGREVTTIVSEQLSAGNHVRQWNAKELPSGVYFYRLQAGSFSETKKLILMK